MLRDWLSEGGVDAGIAGELSGMAGATVVGRRMFDVGEWEATPYPVPCFVLTHEQREGLAVKSGTFTFVTDGIESALEQAKEAAGEKDGLLDELRLVVHPRILGRGEPSGAEASGAR